MKIYTLDMGWKGSAVCVAESREQAIEMFMADDYVKYTDVRKYPESIKENEIKNGFLFVTVGDS